MGVFSKDFRDLVLVLDGRKDGEVAAQILAFRSGIIVCHSIWSLEKPFENFSGRDEKFLALGRIVIRLSSFSHGPRLNPTFNAAYDECEDRNLEHRPSVYAASFCLNQLDVN